MKFDHLIEINDPLNSLIEPLTRAQLWRGLMLRVQSPKLFVPWLDECVIVRPGGDKLERTLRYGEVSIKDQVSFTPEQLIQIDVPTQPDIVASSLSMQIEEPKPNLFFVRFSYDDGIEEADGSMDAFYNEFRHSAYRESDIDTIRIVRELTAEGRFNLPMI
jgi:hypothetical protein